MLTDRMCRAATDAAGWWLVAGDRATAELISAGLTELLANGGDGLSAREYRFASVAAQDMENRGDRAGAAEVRAELAIAGHQVAARMRAGTAAPGDIELAREIAGDLDAGGYIGLAWQIRSNLAVIGLAS
jgi:hypothetical protein